MMKRVAGSIITALAMCGASQAGQQPPPTSPANPGQQGNQNPGNTNPVGQTGQPPAGQAGQNTVGQPGQSINGQPRQNAAGQNSGIKAQPTTGQFGDPLYQHPDVRQSLKLTEEQINRLNAANKQLEQRYQNERARLDSLTPAERSAEIQRLTTTGRTDFYRSANDVFTPAQLQRYRELEYQYQGPSAFGDPDIRARLNLTDDQVRRFQSLQTDYRPHQSFLVNADGSVRNDGPKQYQLYRQRVNEQMEAILSQEQRDRWRNLIGEQYSFQPYVSSAFVR